MTYARFYYLDGTESVTRSIRPGVKNTCVHEGMSPLKKYILRMI